MRIVKLGAMTAEDALDAARQGEANAKTFTDTVDQPADNGFPGFSAIWDRVWGALPGILSPSANIASTSPVVLPQAGQSSMLPLLAVAAVGGFLILKSGKRARR